jgi:hypothetical protein
VCNIGHGVKEIAAVMSSQAAELACNPFHCSHTQAYEEMAERLIRLAPKGFAKVFGVSSGSEAVENAVKFGRQYHVARGLPSKQLTISRWQSYHGNTLGALACSGYTSRRRKHAPLLERCGPHPTGLLLSLPLRKTYPACELKCARALESAILQEGPENVSAFIAEPVVGAALGGVPAPPGYFEKVREICDRYEVLFIADEVMCGLGRTGANFAIDHWSVVPDLIATGKGMGSGYFPMGASLVSEKIAAAMQARGAVSKGCTPAAGTCWEAGWRRRSWTTWFTNELIDEFKAAGSAPAPGLERIKEPPALGRGCEGPGADVRGRVRRGQRHPRALPGRAEGGRAGHGRLPGARADRFSRPRDRRRDGGRPPPLGPAPGHHLKRDRRRCSRSWRMGSRRWSGRFQELENGAL